MSKGKSRDKEAPVTLESHHETLMEPRNNLFAVLADLPSDPDDDPISSICRPPETNAGRKKNRRTRRRNRQKLQMEKNKKPTAEDLEGGQDIAAVDGELRDLQVKHDKVVLAMEDPQKKQAEVELERSREEQIAALQQSLHSQMEGGKKILQEQKEEVIRLNNLLEKKEQELLEANMCAKNHREALYKLDDINCALQAVQGEHLTCEKEKRLLLEAVEHHREEASKMEEHFMEMLAQREEAFQRELAEMREKFQKELVDRREAAQRKEEEVQSLRQDNGLSQELPKKKVKTVKRFWARLFSWRKRKDPHASGPEAIRPRTHELLVCLSGCVTSDVLL